MTIDELVKLLIYKSGKNLTELAAELNISRQTLSNWRSGRIYNIDPETIKKLESAMQRNKWGIKLTSISHNNIEVTDILEVNKPPAQETVLDKNTTDQVIEHFIKYTNRLEEEIKVLKEQLTHYGVKK
jgi:transcriptional regulator with XRE-family HTH domain